MYQSIKNVMSFQKFLQVTGFVSYVVHLGLQAVIYLVRFAQEEEG